MQKNTHLLATLVLITGLIAPTSMHAGFFDNFFGWAGASAGATVGHRAANVAADEIGELIPKPYRKYILIGGGVAIIAYLIYTSGNSDNVKSKKEKRALSCGKKGCSHKGCR